jgi:hypothetical protein
VLYKREAVTETRIINNILLGKPQWKDHLADLGVDEKMIFKIWFAKRNEIA